MGSKQNKNRSNSFDLIHYSYYHNSMQSRRVTPQRPAVRSQKPHHTLRHITIALLVVCGAWAYMTLQNKQNNASSPQVKSASTTVFNKDLYSSSDPSSVWVIVNKQLPLPDDFTPSSLRNPSIPLRLPAEDEEMKLAEPAAEALEKLAAAAQEDGMSIMLGSGYRSIVRQKQIFEESVTAIGQKETENLSALPGTSEHHTGLAVDLEEEDRKCEFQVCFENTSLFTWLKNNAYKYGYILRYIPDKSEQTGYSYEPWHFRYVGTELALELQNSSPVSLEEFFNK